MKARDIIGKRIAKVWQQRTKDNSGSRVHHIEQIDFDDGSVLRLHVAELPGDYAVLGKFYPRPSRPDPRS